MRRQMADQTREATKRTRAMVHAMMSTLRGKSIASPATNATMPTITNAKVTASATIIAFSRIGYERAGP